MRFKTMGEWEEFPDGFIFYRCPQYKFGVSYVGKGFRFDLNVRPFAKEIGGILKPLGSVFERIRKENDCLCSEYVDKETTNPSVFKKRVLNQLNNSTPLYSFSLPYWFRRKKC